jgi:16S rRNA processing protein RimM
MEHKKNKLKWKVSEIVGFEVFDQRANRIGVLSDVILTGSNDIWVVKYYDEEILIPALKHIVKEVNIARKKIFVVFPKEYEDFYGKVKSYDDLFQYNGYYVYED